MAEPSDACAAILALLAERAPGATVCPSEVARALTDGPGPSDWRRAMPEVHAAVDALAAGGSIRLSWKGASLEARSGPYRIGRAGAAKP